MPIWYLGTLGTAMCGRSGDWMARSLYLEGSREYKHHVEHYGHPSEVGFKDILPLFKAENGIRTNWFLL